MAGIDLVRQASLVPFETDAGNPPVGDHAAVVCCQVRMRVLSDDLTRCEFPEDEAGNVRSPPPSAIKFGRLT